MLVLLMGISAGGGGLAQDADAAVSEPAPDAAIEVQVHATRGDPGRRLQDSSAAVIVADTRSAQAESGDLGALLSRQQGVNVQRSGALGAQTRISVLGLGEDQIRFYIDGVPLSFTGLPESIAYVPVDLVSRAEIFRGVVPIRFGGDTLGGAIQLVSHEPQAGAHGSASLTVGSFDTQRVAVRAQLHDVGSGVYASASGFLDRAQNDYAMDGVPVTQPNGRKQPRRVYRLHDAYRGGYGQVEVGLLDRPYAKRLLLRAFNSGFDKEINHDLLMLNPYGEVLSRRRARGATLFYDHTFRRRLTLEAKLGYAHRDRQLRDLGGCARDWYGDCVSELPNRGEISNLPLDRKTSDHNLFMRMQLGLRLSPLLQFRASLAPTYTASSSYDPATLAGIPDLFSQDRRLLGLTLGVEHELDAFAGRLENVLFVKDYLQELRADATVIQGMKRFEQSHRRFGVGNATRLRLAEPLIAKLSYELGTRLPDGNEVFGDGVFVEANLALSPETSHNLNVELRWSYEAPRFGQASLAGTGFFRHVEDLVFLVPGTTMASYQNLTTARLKGVEGALHYLAPKEYLSVDGNLTFQDMRNLATSGPFAMFEGKRIPNRPYLFANLSVTAKLSQVAGERDTLALTFRETFVGEFRRAFEVTRAQEVRPVPRQLVSSLVLTYEVFRQLRAMSASVEANNLTDARVYDFFGVQRPGRYVLAKFSYRM